MRDPVKTREKLLQTAVELVWQSNYCSVGVKEICTQAGVTKGAFYHHFESKADLFYAAAQHHWDATKAEWDAIFSPSLSPLEQLESLIEHLIVGQRENQVSPPDDALGGALEVTGCPFFSAGGQVGLEETKVRQAAVEMAARSVRYTSALVRGLKASGCLNGNPDAEQVGRMAFTFVQGLFIYGRAHNSLAAVEADLRDGLYRMLDLKAAYRRETYREGHEDAMSPVAASL